ncbi:MAG TPA: hypothetical protein VGM77_07770 [Gemmatimonadales bacterium]
MTRSAVPLLLLAACAGHAAPPAAAPALIPITIESLTADSIAHAMVQRAFTADARLETPDSLYLDDAEIITNGTPRADAPRFAGVSAGGSIQLGSSRFSVTGSYVWGSVQYRWVPATPAGKLVEGWATFVIVRRRTGDWRIAHVHSSTPAPADAAGG